MSLRSLRLLRTAVLAVLALSLAGFGGQSLTRVWRLMQEVDSLEREVAVRAGVIWTSLSGKRDALELFAKKLRLSRDDAVRLQKLLSLG